MECVAEFYEITLLEYYKLNPQDSAQSLSKLQMYLTLKVWTHLEEWRET